MEGGEAMGDCEHNMYLPVTVNLYHCQVTPCGQVLQSTSIPPSNDIT